MKSDHAFTAAEDRYRSLGVDVQQAMETLAGISLSIHCWQGDDLGGFETPDAALSGGGIQVTGNYPGKARSVEELRQDFKWVFSLIPGTHRLALHASYGDFSGKKVDRDEVTPEHFIGWCDWAAAQEIKLDFNSTYFSHPLADDGYTLSHKDDKIRHFWIRHAQACRHISADMGRRLGSACIHNIWIPDGDKDLNIDRYGYRKLLLESLDEIFQETLDPRVMKDAVESKLFGIGSESFVVGSYDFYLGYALSRNKMICIDTGHFHLSESVADKVSALCLFTDEIFFHISRPVRWDSDHVVILDDPVRALCQELVRSGALKKSYLGLDFFDGTMNRVGAYAIGARATQKALLLALLEPRENLKSYQDKGDYFARLALLEELKILPFGAIWDAFCEQHGAPLERELIENVHQYEQAVTAKR